MSDNKFEKIMETIVAKYSNTMQKLALSEQTHTQKELDIALWLLNNKDGLLEQISSSHNKHWHLLPPQVLHIYLDNYKNLVINSIKQQLQLNFELNPEEMTGLITTKFITKVLGKNFLEPPK